MTAQKELDTLIAKMNHPKRILLVDDNTVLLDTLASWFEAQNMVVVKATTPEQGIEAYKDGEFDVAIVDLVFPPGHTALDGIDLIKHIRSMNPISPPIVLLTGYPNHERMKTLGDIPGPVTVFAKPQVNLQMLTKFLMGGA